MKQIEAWVSIPNYEGLYQISNFGRILSVNYNHTNSSQIMQPSPNSNGYMQTALWKNGKRKYYTVSQLMGSAFFGVKQIKNIVIRHKDGNKLNDNLSNLEPTTHRKNISFSKNSNFTGVTKHKNKFRARINIYYYDVHIGLFDTEQEAYNAYKIWEIWAEKNRDLFTI